MLLGGKKVDPLYEYKGQMMTITAIARASGLKRSTVRSRVDRGMTIDQATANVNYKSAVKYEHNGKVYSLRSLSNQYGIAYLTLSRRVSSGMPIEQALSMPYVPRGVEDGVPYEQDERIKKIVAANPGGLDNIAIAKILGVSRERVRQIVEVALKKLMRDRHIKTCAEYHPPMTRYAESRRGVRAA